VAASAAGVLWGAAAIVLMLAWGTGFRDYMKLELGSFGRPMVFVFPALTSSGFEGFRKGVPIRFEREQAQILEHQSHEVLEAVLAEHTSEERFLVDTPEGRARRFDLSGVEARYGALRRFRLGHGRFFDESDVAHARPFAVLGFDAAIDLFGSAEAAVGARIRIDGHPFEVIGVADKKGRQYTNTNRPDNRLVLVPITTAEAHLGFRKESVSRLLLVPRTGIDGETAFRTVVGSLGPLCGFHPDDPDAVKHFDLSKMLGMVDLFYAGFMIFIGIAGSLTLAIGGIGVANYQLATLAERSLEIAVARAIGARTRTVVAQTALEALVVAGGAAVAGVVLGLAGCLALATLPPPGMFPAPIISPVVVGITVSALLAVAAAASILPALRVRQMDVATALRGG
jgi:putative ABC transport system permease protein